MQRICIVGAGAIGGLLAVRLSATGQNVTVIDRDPHLTTMRRRGLTLVRPDGGQERATALRCAARAGDVGPVDLVVLGVKAQDIPVVAPGLPALYHADTAVLTLQNGIPWWYFQRYEGPLAGTCLEELDPDGVVSRHIPIERVVGCVAYPAAALVEPGVVRHVEGTRFAIGEPDGSQSPRLAWIGAALQQAGFKCHAVQDIRSELWLKAWGALAFNPLSALTRATLVELCRFPETRRLASEMMREAQSIAGKLGASFRVGIEQRIAGAEAVGAHKTSMLQDLEAGQRMEIAAIIGAVASLGRLTQTPCPAIDAVHACVKLLDEVTAGARASLSQPALATG